MWMTEVAFGSIARPSPAALADASSFRKAPSERPRPPIQPTRRISRRLGRKWAGSASQVPGWGRDISRLLVNDSIPVLSCGRGGPAGRRSPGPGLRRCELHDQFGPLLDVLELVRVEVPAIAAAVDEDPAVVRGAVDPG